MTALARLTVYHTKNETYCCQVRTTSDVQPLGRANPDGHLAIVGGSNQPVVDARVDALGEVVIGEVAPGAVAKGGGHRRLTAVSVPNPRDRQTMRHTGRGR